MEEEGARCRRREREFSTRNINVYLHIVCWVSSIYFIRTLDRPTRLARVLKDKIYIYIWVKVRSTAINLSRFMFIREQIECAEMFSKGARGKCETMRCI